MPYDSSWDRPHLPGPEAAWQESDCWWFMDIEQKVGGFQRIGQTPNRGATQIMLFAFAAGGKRYLGTRDGKPGDWERWADGQRVETHRAEAIGDERMRFSWDEPDCSAELEFYDSFHTPRDWQEKPPDAVTKDMAPGGHLECGGRARGTLRIGEKTYKIDALAHRDRSWGARDWTIAGQSKMFSGTVGPALSWATYAFQHRETGVWYSAGYVVRDGRSEEIAALRVLSTYDTDSFTSLGGEGRLLLKSGETIIIPCKPVQAFVTCMSDFAAVDNLCLVEFEGHRGFVDLELMTNPGRGPFLHFPKQSEVSFVCVNKGLSQSADYKL